MKRTIKRKTVYVILLVCMILVGLFLLYALSELGNGAVFEDSEIFRAVAVFLLTIPVLLALLIVKVLFSKKTKRFTDKASDVAAPKEEAVSSTETQGERF